MTTFTIHPQMKERFTPETISETEEHIIISRGTVYFYKFSQESDFQLIDEHTKINELRQNETEENTLTLYRADTATFERWQRRGVIVTNPETVVATKPQAQTEQKEQKDRVSPTLRPLTFLSSPLPRKRTLDINFAVKQATQDYITFNPNNEFFWTVYNLQAIKELGASFAKYFQDKTQKEIETFFSVKSPCPDVKDLVDSRFFTSSYFNDADFGKQYILAYWQTLIYAARNDRSLLEKSLDSLLRAKEQMRSSQLVRKSAQILEHVSGALTNTATEVATVINDVATKASIVAKSLYDAYSFVTGTEGAKRERTAIDDEESFALEQKQKQRTSPSKASVEEKHSSASKSSAKKDDENWDDFEEVETSKVNPLAEEPGLVEKLAILIPAEQWWAIAKTWVTMSYPMEAVPKVSAGLVLEGQETKASEKESPKEDIAMQRQYIKEELEQYLRHVSDEIVSPLYDQDFSSFKRELLFIVLQEVKSAQSNKELLFLIESFKYCVQVITEYFDHEPGVLAAKIDRIISDLVTWRSSPPRSFLERLKAQREDVSAPDAVPLPLSLVI